MPVPLPIRHALDRLTNQLEEPASNRINAQHLVTLALVWVACTALLILFRPGYTFPPYGGLDGWIYSAYQWDLKNQIADFGPTYYGSRLSWILPGALFQSLLPVSAANIAYKLTLSAFFAVACATILYRAMGLGAAVLAIALSVFAPQIIEALHTDYIDTAVIIYAALTLACITAARDSSRWPALIFLGGCCFTGMAIANLSALSSIGMGVAVYHLLWLRWGVRRQVACVGLYVAAAAFVYCLIGLIHRAAGGPFHFLKPQLDMVTYMRGLKENPWMPKDPLWFTEASWLLLPVSALLWGLYCSLLAPPTDDRKRQLTRSLTAGLATSFLLASFLQYRALNPTLSSSFYASYHLCLALPLLVACLTSATQSRSRSGVWLLVTLVVLPVVTIAWNSARVSYDLFPFLRFLHSYSAAPFLGVSLLMLASTLIAFAARRSKTGGLPWLQRPEFLLLGIITGSMSFMFHNPAMSDRLRERYESVHAAYRVLAREFPAGSYRFWVHLGEKNGRSLASTKLWGYRLFSLKFFPEFEAANLAAINDSTTLVIPSAPGRGHEVLVIAARVLGETKYVLTAPRVISVPGDAGIGFDLVCFSLHQTPIDPEKTPGESMPTDVLMDLKFDSAQPYTLSLAQNIYGPQKGAVINTSTGFPVFTRTDSRDHLATDFHPLRKIQPGASEQISVIATMPADGHCVCVVQVDDCRTIGQINWNQTGRFVHTITVPAGSTSIRLYLQGGTDRPTALPTRITVYELHDPPAHPAPGP